MLHAVIRGDAKTRRNEKSINRSDFKIHVFIQWDRGLRSGFSINRTLATNDPRNGIRYWSNAAFWLERNFLRNCLNGHSALSLQNSLKRCSKSMWWSYALGKYCWFNSQPSKNYQKKNICDSPFDCDSVQSGRLPPSVPQHCNSRPNTLLKFPQFCRDRWEHRGRIRFYLYAAKLSRSCATLSWMNSRLLRMPHAYNLRTREYKWVVTIRLHCCCCCYCCRHATFKS